MKDSFSKRHPLVGLLFFAFVLAFSMFLMHPVCLGISLTCALINAVWLNGRKTVRFGLSFVLPTALLLMILNPVVNHAGVTILGYLPWDNPLTLESVVYGFASAVMLASVVFWFSSVNTVMTSDKLVYLFGRVIPSLSLVLSMALRFVPRFMREFREVRRAQKMLGNTPAGLIPKLKAGMRALSVMLSYALENSIETADSMKARGYGLKGRTAYSRYRMTISDVGCLLWIVGAAAAVIVLRVLGTAGYRYFPSVRGELWSVPAVMLYLLYAGLMLTPFIINIREAIRWKSLRSRV